MSKKDINFQLDSEAVMEEIEQFIPSLIKKNLTVDGVKKTPLLTIELDSMGDVPKVFYRGEKIDGKVSVKFDWHTRDFNRDGVSDFEIKHGEIDRHGRSFVKSIRYGFFGTDE